MQFLVIGHLSDREQEWLIATAATADEAVAQFASHAFGGLDPEDLGADYDELEDAKLNGDADDIAEQTREAVQRAVEYWRDGTTQDHDLPDLYVDHVFGSESPLTAIDASLFPGGTGQ